jgi:hypothetical protein
MAEDSIEDPFTFRMKQNFPNPFRYNTQIEFSIVKSEKITLRVYNLSGKQATVLVDDMIQPGEYSVTWNAENQAG